MSVIKEIFIDLDDEEKREMLLIATRWAKDKNISAISRAPIRSKTSPQTSQSVGHDGLNYKERYTLLVKNKKILAIKMVRERLGCDIVQAKDIVDAAG